MSKEPNNIDRLVREKLDGFEMTPPASVWENTSAALQAGRKRRFFLWFTLGIAVLAILGTTIYLYSYENSENDLLASNQTNTTIKDNSLKGESNKKSFKNESRSGDAILTNREDETTKNSTDSEQDLSTHGINKKGDVARIHLDGYEKKLDAGQDDLSSKKQSGKDHSSLRPGLDSGDTDNANSGGSNAKSSNTFRGNDSMGENKMKPSSPLQNGVGSQVSINNGSSNESVDYSALPLYDLGLLNGVKPTTKLVDLDQKSMRKAVPKRQLFSLEGSIGVSTFNDRADEKTTEPQLFSILNGAASNRQSFDARLGLNYLLTHRLSIQTGIHYNSSSEDYTFNGTEVVTYSYNDTISFSVDSVTMDTTYNINTVYYDSTTVTAKNVRNTYKIFSLPFQFAWNQPISPRSSLEFAMGGELSLFGKNTGTTILDESTTLPASSAHRTSGMLSIGGSIKYLYNFGNRHAVYVEPWVQFGVSNQHTPQLNYTSLRSRAGIRFGYRIYL